MSNQYHSFWGKGKVLRAKLTDWFYKVDMLINEHTIMSFRILEDLDKAERDCKPGKFIHFNAQINEGFCTMERWETEAEFEEKMESYLKEKEKEEKK